MASAAMRATRRAVVEHANRTATGTNLALQVSTQIGLEWRAFANLSFVGRLRWLLTGKVRHAAPAATRDEEQIVADARSTASGETV